MENITDLWGSDDNSYSMISSYNQYLPMPLFTKLYDLTIIQRNDSLADAKGIVGKFEDGISGLNTSALVVLILAGFLILSSDHLQGYNAQSTY